MLQHQTLIINNMLLIADAICVIIAGYGAFYLNDITSSGSAHLSAKAFAFIILSMTFINSYFMGKFGLYSEVRHKNLFNLSWSLIKVLFFNFVFLSFGLFFFEGQSHLRNFLFYCAALTFVLTLIYRLTLQVFLNRAAKNGFNASRILIVGDLQRTDQVQQILTEQLSWGHKIVGRLKVGDEPEPSGNVLGSLDELEAVLKRHTIDEVVFAVCGDRSLDLAPYLFYCHRIGVSVRILPAMWNRGECRLSIDNCQGVPFLTLESSPISASGLLYKRLLDIFGGLIGTLAFILMYPFIALFIKFDSPGPVLFKQKRMGRHGRVFNLYKFRTMYTDAEDHKAGLITKNEMNGAIFKLTNDPRITPAGQFLRKTSIDEIPQFWNVLKGEMSLVGTRPPTLDEVTRYQPEHLKRISAKPGITGLWQVSGRNEITDFDQIVELDCRYMDNWRFLDDLKILAKTVWVVLRLKGAR